jgi:hypothetical protein
MKNDHSNKRRFRIQFPSKDALDYFNVILNAVKNGGLIFVGASAFFFFLCPSVQIFVRDKIKKESLWFYVGSWNPVTRKFRDDKDHNLNFYFTKHDYDDRTGAINQGAVLLEIGETSLGRTGSSTEHAAKIAISKKECIHVLENSSRDDSVHSGISDKIIWVRALPNACKSY